MEAQNQEYKSLMGLGALSTKDLNFYFLNVRSVRVPDKLDKIKEAMDRLANVHVICLVETWLQEKKTPFFEILGYKAFHNTRNSGRGGGISLYVREEMKIISCDMFGDGIQLSSLKLQVAMKPMNVVVAYNPTVLLYTDCLDLLEPVLDKIGNENCIVLGDFNIDIKRVSVQSDAYLNWLAARNYSILNNKITRPDSNTVIDHIPANCMRGESHIYTVANDISDHNVIVVSLKNGLSKEVQKIIQNFYIKIDYPKARKILEGKVGNVLNINETEALSEALHFEIENALKEAEVKCALRNNVKKLNPWATPELPDLSTRKQALYKETP